MSSMGVTLPTMAASSPTRIVFFQGVRNFGWIAAKNFLRQQAVVGHRIEHARLAQQHDQHHAGEAGQGAER